MVGLPYVFTRRSFNVSLDAAWAHFGLEVVVGIKRQLSVNVGAPIQYLRSDQAALMYILLGVEQYELQQRVHERIYDAEEVWDAQSNRAIGEALSFERHTKTLSVTGTSAVPSQMGIWSGARQWQSGNKLSVPALRPLKDGCSGDPGVGIHTCFIRTHTLNTVCYDCYGKVQTHIVF